MNGGCLELTPVGPSIKWDPQIGLLNLKKQVNLISFELINFLSEG